MLNGLLKNLQLERKRVQHLFDILIGLLFNGLGASDILVEGYFWYMIVLEVQIQVKIGNTKLVVWEILKQLFFQS